jgi:ribokinase
VTKYAAIGFGALNVDRLFRVNKIAGREEESFVTEYQEFCGGSAANTVVGLARLGLRVGYVGKVADDGEGQLLRNNFVKEGVDTEGTVVTDEGHSGLVMGFVDKEGERALYVAPGVNDAITLDEVNMDYVKQAGILHLTSFVGEKPFETQVGVVDQLPMNVKVSFDPGMLYAKKGLQELRPIIKRVFAMCPNELEVKQLTGQRYEEGAATLIAEGARVVAVKLGKRGCYVTDGSQHHLLEAFEVKVVDTTGAGDAWNAGFLYGLLKNRSLEDCGNLGNFVASRCIVEWGARTGLPRLAELPTL